DLKRVRFPRGDQRGLRFPEDAERLHAYLDVHPTGMVILDPLTAFITGFSNATRAREALDSLGEVSRHTDIPILILHHFTKSGRSDVYAAIAGAGAVTDLARAVYIYGSCDADTATEFDRDPARLRVLANLKLSAAPRPPSLVYEVAKGVVPNLRTPVPRM